MNIKIINKFLLLSLFLAFLSGCGSYDSGYDDGYDGASRKLVILGTGNYTAGYSDGEEDAYYYDLGYQDAQNNKPPRHSSIEEYMEGYREGR
jgi:hypothetical protein